MRYSDATIVTCRRASYTASAQRHVFSFDAVATMLDAVVNGNGGMAQFSHHEFGGSGQWMRGGMNAIVTCSTTTSRQVEALCADLMSLIANQPGLIQSGSFQSRRRCSTSMDMAVASSNNPAVALAARSVCLCQPREAGRRKFRPRGAGWLNSTARATCVMLSTLRNRVPAGDRGERDCHSLRHARSSDRWIRSNNRMAGRGRFRASMGWSMWPRCRSFR